MDPLVAYPLPGDTGYTWTIASRISDALHKAETLYGERDKTFFFAGFEFNQTHPRIWYPGDRKHIVIQLGPTAKADFQRAIYQLAHEVVHLLSPTGTSRASVLEEGLAEHFSEEYLFIETGRSILPDVMAYATARDMVRKLLAIDSAAIKRLRCREPQLCLFTPELIKSEFPGIQNELAEILCAPFVRL